MSFPKTLGFGGYGFRPTGLGGKGIAAILRILNKGLNYDKAGGSLTNSITSTSTVIDYQGTVLTLPAGVIRFPNARYIDHADGKTYNTGIATGWEALDTDSNGVKLIPAPAIFTEIAATNLLSYSEEFDNVNGWTDQRTTQVGNTTISPRGDLTADSIIVDTSGGTHNTFHNSYTSIASVEHTASIYVKQSTLGVNAQLRISNATGTNTSFLSVDLATGLEIASGATGTATLIRKSIEQVGSWYKISITFTEGSASTSYGYMIRVLKGTVESYTGNGTDEIYAWGAQMEKGSYPTSYIPTTTAAVTRALESIKLPLASGTNFNQAEGLLLFRFTPTYDFKVILGYGVFSVRSGTGFLYRLANENFLRSYDGTSSVVTPVFTANTENLEILACLFYSTSLNKRVIGKSEDLGVTWQWGVEGTYDGAYDITGNTFRILGDPGSKLHSALLYGNLPGTTVVEVQTWVEANAGNLT